MIPAYPPVPEWTTPSGWDSWIRRIARTVNLLNRGKMNVQGRVTLTPGASSTVIVDERIGAYSVVLLEAETANAAKARAQAQGIYIVPESGQATVYHASGPDSDETFRYVIFG